MNRIVLDTSAYSAFMRGNAEALTTLQEADEIYLNPIILGELLAGFMKGRRRAQNEKELREFLSSPRVRIVPVDDETSSRYAVILNSLWKNGTPVPTNDIWIAATAMQYGLPVFSADGHYQKIPQIMLHELG